MKSTITQVLLFYKDMCTLSLLSIYLTRSMLNFNVCVCVSECVGAGGYSYGVVLILFFRIQS